MIKVKIEDSLSSIRNFWSEYEWIADSFVLDFYVEDHWSKLPETWQLALDSMTPSTLGEWLEGTLSSHSHDLDTFHSTVTKFSISRSSSLNLPPDDKEMDPKVSNLFKKHVKLKKRHEIQRLGKVITSHARMTSVDTVLDIGSGLGHLSRYLAFNHNLSVTCVDAVPSFIRSAEKLDAEFTRSMTVFNKKPNHVSLKLEMDKTSDLLSEFGSFGIVGLHTCGDLGPLLVQTFASSPGSQFLVSVGCCYMKMTQNGYPMSEFTKNECKIRLSYEAREVACHAIEDYIHNLKTSGHSKLKIHCYRAALEYLISKKYPSRRKEGLAGVKKFEEKGFSLYAEEALRKTDMKFTNEELGGEEIKGMLEGWWRVVTFYSLRILLAQLIESVILLDRSLYLLEKGYNSELIPVFDSRISPRNIALLCSKSV